MVGIGISSASAGSDAVSLARSSRGSSANPGDSAGGFSDALSHSSNGRDSNAPSKAAGDNADAGDAQDNASQSQNDTKPPVAPAAATSASGGKAVDAATAQGAAQSFAQSLTAMPQAAGVVPAVAEAAVPAEDVDATSTAEIAQQLAALMDGDPSGKTAADGKGDLPAVKGGKTAATGDKDSDDDTGAADTAGANTTISDALSLLGAALPATVVPAQTAAGVLAAAGQLQTGNGKVDATTDGSVDALSSDAAADKTDAVATGMALLASTAVSNGSDDAGTVTDDDAASQTFSVARVNSKVQALDLAASKNADEAAQLDLKTAAGDGAGITVLESRRFIGLAEGSNSSLVANSLTSNKDWAAAMQPSAALTGASVTTSASKVMNTLKIQMNPDNLGVVTATMRLAGEQLSVDLKVQSAEAYRQLSNDQSAIVDSLRQQGYSVDRITVSYTFDTSSNNQSSYQGQQQQQQSGASQGQGSEGQARKQNSGQQAGDQDAVWGTGNVGANDSAAGSAQRARSGGVYL